MKLTMPLQLKINENKSIKINLLVNKLINDNGENGIYIGVTATPGRLDVNNTF